MLNIAPEKLMNNCTKLQYEVGEMQFLFIMKLERNKLNQVVCGMYSVIFLLANNQTGKINNLAQIVFKRLFIFFLAK